MPAALNEDHLPDWQFPTSCSTEMLGDKKTKNFFFKILRGVCTTVVCQLEELRCNRMQLFPLQLVHIYIINNCCNCSYY